MLNQFNDVSTGKYIPLEIFKENSSSILITYLKYFSERYTLLLNSKFSDPIKLADIEYSLNKGISLTKKSPEQLVY